VRHPNQSAPPKDEGDGDGKEDDHEFGIADDGYSE
jgi:hypothetical protein